METLCHKLYEVQKSISDQFYSFRESRRWSGPRNSSTQKKQLRWRRLDSKDDRIWSCLTARFVLLENWWFKLRGWESRQLERALKVYSRWVINGHDILLAILRETRPSHLHDPVQEHYRENSSQTLVPNLPTTTDNHHNWWCARPFRVKAACLARALCVHLSHCRQDRADTSL